jgi:hypothetical protein
VKPNIKSVQVHPQLSNDGYPVDGALVGAGSFSPKEKHDQNNKNCP